VRRSVAALLTLVTVVLVTGCGGDGPELAALRGDPMADYAPPGATLERRAEERAGSPLGKPRPATVRLVWITAGGDPAGHVADAEAAAAAAGWDFDPGPGPARLAHRTVSDVPATLAISARPDGAGARLVITLQSEP
jgi:hypothetical protein